MGKRHTIMHGLAVTGLVIGSSVAPLGAAAAATSSPAVVCQGGQAGCVLPARAATPAPTPVIEEEGGGMGWLLPALLGLAAVAGAILILSDDDDDEDLPISP